MMSEVRAGQVLSLQSCVSYASHAVSSKSQACTTQNTLVLVASDMSVCRPCGSKAKQFHGAAHVDTSLESAEEFWLLALLLAGLCCRLSSKPKLFLNQQSDGHSHLYCVSLLLEPGSLTVTSSRNSSIQLKSWLMYWGSLRIMPGAFSRASHKHTRNSAASCLMPSGN